MYHTLLVTCVFFFLMIRRPPRSTLSSSSAASDVYKRQVLTSKMAPLRVSYRVCHAGDRKAKKKEGEFDRGKPVLELNDGAVIEHCFCAPGEQIKVDLEALATKSGPLLKNYTNPGGLTLALAVEYTHLGEDSELYGSDVKIIGSTKRKRAQKQLADPHTPPSRKTTKTRKKQESFTVLEESPVFFSPMSGCPSRADRRTPLAGLTPNTCAQIDELKEIPFYAIKPSPQLMLQAKLELDDGMEDSELEYLTDMYSSTETAPELHAEDSGDPSSSEDCTALDVQMPIDDVQYEDPIGAAMGLEAFNEQAYLTRMLGS
eukprot:TRINITY_DN13962_c0_g1_i1.p1 TRINITY_DN13962_c0_g1~~TRINITY_DN13962_c0_g1_i1.p1  ORF type:complete len:316 (+),score=91.19 TRINITY_DN13962_c0_g1_i1:24-971(+)